MTITIAPPDEPTPPVDGAPDETPLTKIHSSAPLTKRRRADDEDEEELAGRRDSDDELPLKK